MRPCKTFEKRIEENLFEVKGKQNFLVHKGNFLARYIRPEPYDDDNKRAFKHWNRPVEAIENTVRRNRPVWEVHYFTRREELHKTLQRHSWRYHTSRNNG